MNTDHQTYSGCVTDEIVRVLIVEDEAVTAMSLKESIRSFGWNCTGISHTAESAFAAVEKETPDIVFMDISLRGMIDGVDAAEILRSRHGVHVIFLTAYSDHATVSRIRASEPYGYVLKPFKEEDIYISVNLALTLRDMTRKLREKDDRLDSALSATRIGTWKFDLRKNVAAIDASMCAIMGLPAQERHMSWDELKEYIHPDDRDLVFRESCRVRDSDGFFETDGRIVQPDGSVCWIRNRGQSRIDTDGVSRYLTGAVCDVTERKQLEDKVIGIRESQRQEIGQILHDDLGQQLAGISLLSESLVALLESHALTAEAEKARTIANRTYHALDDLRRVARNLYPVQISPDGFSDALATLVCDAQSMSGMQCVFENTAGKLYLDNAQATQIYYIVREAVNNAIKHSSALKIRIVVRREGPDVIVSVEDNGRGLNPSMPSKGIGMDIMRFRANMCQGEFSVESAGRKGTVIRIAVREKEKAEWERMHESES